MPPASSKRLPGGKGAGREEKSFLLSPTHDNADRSASRSLKKGAGGSGKYKTRAATDPKRTRAESRRKTASELRRKLAGDTG